MILQVSTSIHVCATVKFLKVMLESLFLNKILPNCSMLVLPEIPCFALLLILLLSLLNKTLVPKVFIGIFLVPSSFYKLTCMR